MSQPSPVSRGTHPGTGHRIAAAALELFADRGYHATTVDAIAERAGIARRTFFRYFRSKDDVILPDHDSLLAMVEAHLATGGAADPMVAVCGAVRLVFLSYLDDPKASLQRYRVTRTVAALRERELASVQRYERAFSAYLRRRLADSLPEAQAVLRADVIAASVVAAHNAILREWLRAGADYEPLDDLDRACRWVSTVFGPETLVKDVPVPVPSPAVVGRSDRSEPENAGVREGGGGGGREGEDGRPGEEGEERKREDGGGGEDGGEGERAGEDEVIVAVFRSGHALGDVVERIQNAL